jgi:F-type H+-transporting ATPase subunit a
MVERSFPFEVFRLGGVPVRDTVLVTAAITVALAVLAWLATRRLAATPRALQNAMEAVVEAMEDLVHGVAPEHTATFVPFIGTLGLFLLVANCVPVLPGVGAPTRDVSTTAALAVLVFLSVHYYGIRIAGWRRYFAGYLRPHWILLPLNVISEVTRTVALALRLFGNMLSGQLVVAILVVVAGLLVPVPMQLLGLLIGIIQAYVFTLLAMVYIAAGLQTAAAGDTP